LFVCFSPEQVAPYIAVDLMCLWEEVISGSSYILDQNFEIDQTSLFGVEQDGGGVGDLDFVSSQEFSWIGIKPF